MKLFRFMSNEEFEKYLKGKTLRNNTKHKAKTNSIGFCFLDADEYKPSEALNFLIGIVSMDVCAVFKTDKKMKKTYGVYAKQIKSTGNFLKDFIDFFNEYEKTFTANEYCTTRYSTKDFKLVKYSKSVWNNKELKWEKVECLKR